MKSNTEAGPELIDVYAYRHLAGDVAPDAIEFLMLRRSTEVIYAGQWRMIGGKIKSGETAVNAAWREFREETGSIPELFWCVPTVNSFFDFKKNKLHHIPVFAVALSTDASIKLNHEHDLYDWFAPAKAAGRVLWPEQARIIQLIPHLLDSAQGKLPREWIVDPQDAAIFS